jgi:dimethylargininase
MGPRHADGSGSVAPDGRRSVGSFVTASERRFGAQSMTSPLRDVLVKRPGAAFGRAFDDPANGFLHPVDLELAQREHDRFVEVLSSLGPRVHLLDAELESPDLVYTFDPLLVGDRGAILLRPGKVGRRSEPAAIEAWTSAAGIPVAGRIEAPGTIEGGDTAWLRPDLLCIGRSHRTNEAGARQLAEIVGGDVRVFDLPYWRGPAELIHLLSVISPVADDLAVVFPPLMPLGLWTLCRELGIRMLEVPEEELGTLACNVLAVRPGVVIVAEGNPSTARALTRAGCEVHAYPATEIGINGSGGPTCMTRPILRD